MTTQKELTKLIEQAKDEASEKIARELYENIVESPEGELLIWKVVLDKIIGKWLKLCKQCNKPLIFQQRVFCSQKCNIDSKRVIK